ncbi:MAG TPA: hypothetical protein PKZ84_10200 [Anaerolineae bacterium]|nr:hypothetical protein [Anaerolineae bacterium]HQI84994.1 hypothetical protein [Anaerolineae bacterium]
MAGLEHSFPPQLPRNDFIGVARFRIKQFQANVAGSEQAELFERDAAQLKHGS